MGLGMRLIKWMALPRGVIGNAIVYVLFDRLVSRRLHALQEVGHMGKGGGYGH